MKPFKSGITAEYIKKFKITDQLSLMEIAKLCAQQDGRTTAEHLEKFGIKDPEALIKLNKICAPQTD